MAGLILALVAVVAATERGAQELGAQLGELWPNPSKIPFVIDASLGGEDARVRNAISHWQNKTCIRFVDWTGEANYIRFKLDPTSCWSKLGMVNPVNEIKVSPGCPPRGIATMIGHALGLVNEHTRRDRDRYITIKAGNVKPSNFRDFMKTNPIDVGPYDYNSFMHYPEDAYSKNGKPTIVARTPQSQPLGARGLSPGDVATINFMYGQCKSPAEIKAEGPKCLASVPTDKPLVARPRQLFAITFAARYTSNMTAKTNEGTEAELRPFDGYEYIILTNDKEVGSTVPLEVTFTADSKSVTCRVNVRVEAEGTSGSGTASPGSGTASPGSGPANPRDSTESPGLSEAGASLLVGPTILLVWVVGAALYL